MAITGTEPVFPNNAVAIIAANMMLLDSGLRVFQRPLRAEDPQTSAGVFPAQWNPDDTSVEMRGTPMRPSEPTVQTYTIGIQAFVRDFDEQRGLARHSVLSKLIRTMLYRDDPTRVGLASLTVALGGYVETSRRWGIRTARYLNNEINGDFLYLSTLEFWLETETV